MSDMPASALLGFLVPKLPVLVKTAFMNAFSMSPNASKWDLKTELIIAILRAELSKVPPPTITEQQNNTTKIPEVKGPMWVSKVTMPAPPEDDVLQKLLQAIDDMKTTGTEHYTIPSLLPVEGEWHGRRAGAAKDTPEPAGLSEAERYARLMQEAGSDAVVLYFHGGAYYLMDAASQRPATARYAQMLPGGGGRTFAVRYRLAPQNPFPAALLDALVAYVSLLHPPPGALHAPVPAHRIVLAGDSAGGNLALVLMQTLLQWHRSTASSSSPSPPTVHWHGHAVPIPLPGAMALASPWTDLTRCLPSQRHNQRFDYLPGAEWRGSVYPPCAAWPATPPRAHLYAEADALLHPLGSPCVPAAEWTGCPPTLFVLGEEMMADESRVVAARMVAQGVGVAWMQFEAMPHCFGLVMEDCEAARVMREGWREWVGQVLGGGSRPVETRGEFFAARSCAAKKVDMRRLAEGLEDERVMELMREAQGKLLSEGGRDENKAEQTPVV
ncbi:lipase esterase [Diplodia corticola]|uniref:Lipase esterase n=1 Tax=Diplodia corticola TaxID=236234 RepID=A0A1J9RGV9_9PEZI|nr:lipase esterase [Diplodia corticola]OJD40790.1 lipase esterase [Diplodia corticola]